VASVGLLVFFLFICFSESFKRFLYKEVCYNLNSHVRDLQNADYDFLGEECCVNGEIVKMNCADIPPVVFPNPLESPLSDNKTSSAKIIAKSLSYVPTIAYCNMFSIFYLEIISLTKLVSGKTKSDSLMGMKVNAVISIFYLCLFLMVIIM